MVWIWTEEQVEGMLQKIKRDDHDALLEMCENGPFKKFLKTNTLPNISLITILYCEMILAGEPPGERARCLDQMFAFINSHYPPDPEDAKPA